MDRISEGFNLHETVQAVLQAINAVVCHMLFDAALHGIAIAVIFAALGFILMKSKVKVGKPFINASKRLALFCAVLLVPGLISLMVAGHLPNAGLFNINSMGFIAFWSLVCVHLSAEEMNFQWF